ncbi:hypothetical protein ACIA8K_12735 [Catenuloplanes sp. NPDC051500]|uniref:hypothetical protein n=1 Tax=Catenuloplanes sp. NPDC051500 TaxID=3363959 RepID=UPI003791A789
MDEIERQAHDEIALIDECATADEVASYLTRRVRPAVLRIMADLMHIEFPTDLPRKSTMARAIAREVRA